MFDWLYKKDSETPNAKPVGKPALVVPMTNFMGQSSTDYNKYLEETMEKANLPGPDYFEFSKAIQALNGQPLSEEQKFVVTYPTYVSMKVDKIKLIDSAKQYLTVIANKKVAFNKDLEDAKKTEVTNKQAEVDKKKQEIALLQQKVIEETNLVNTMENEIALTSQKLAIEEAAFANAVIVKENEINNNITKIQTYLK